MLHPELPDQRRNTAPPRVDVLDDGCRPADRLPIPGRLKNAIPRVDRLSPREHLVLRMLGTGYDNRSIAHQLDISERTVKRHITAILLKLDLESRLQAGLVGLAASLGPGATS